MNEDSNKYLMYFIAIIAILCLSAKIIHKITHETTDITISSPDTLPSNFITADQKSGYAPFDTKVEQTLNNDSLPIGDSDPNLKKSQQNLEKNFNYYNFFVNSDKKNLHQPFEIKVKLAQNYNNCYLTASTYSMEHRINFMHSNQKHYSFKSYKKYAHNPLFKEIASKALIQLDFFNWFVYTKELEIIFSDEMLSNCLLEVLKYDDKEISQYIFYNLIDKINKAKVPFVKKTKKDIKKIWNIINTDIVETYLKTLFNSDQIDNTKKINSILKNKKLTKSIAIINSLAFAS